MLREKTRETNFKYINGWAVDTDRDVSFPRSWCGSPIILGGKMEDKENIHNLKEIPEEMSKEREDVKEEVREEIKKEVREKVREEVREEIKEEIKEEII